MKKPSTISKFKMKQNFPEHKSSSECKKNYPVNRVLWTFSVIGGMVGGFSLGILYFFIEPSLLAIIYILFGAFLGAIFGFFPSGLTALYIVKRQFYITSWKSYFHLFFSGASITLLCVGVLVIIEGKEVINLLALSLLGGWSAMLTGYICLPKHNS